MELGLKPKPIKLKPSIVATSIPVHFIRSMLLLFNGFLLFLLLPFRNSPLEKTKAKGEVSDVATRRELAIRKLREDADKNTSFRDFELFVTERGDTLFTQSWIPKGVDISGGEGQCRIMEALLQENGSDNVQGKWDFENSLNGNVNSGNGDRKDLLVDSLPKFVESTYPNDKRILSIKKKPKKRECGSNGQQSSTIRRRGRLNKCSQTKHYNSTCASKVELQCKIESLCFGETSEA